MDQVFSKKNKILKTLGNVEKYWQSQGILLVRKTQNHKDLQW